MKFRIIIGVGFCALLLTFSAWQIVSASNGSDGSDRYLKGALSTAPVTAVLNTLSNKLPPLQAPEDKIVAQSVPEFAELIEVYNGDSHLRGTLVVTDDPNVPAVWPPVDAGATHLRLTFHDLAYYTEIWQRRLDNGWTPGFIHKQMAFPPPSPEEIIFTIDWWQRLDEENSVLAKMAVSAEDGAIAIVSMEWTTDPIGLDQDLSNDRTPRRRLAYRGVERCDAGPWWQLFQLCCHSQVFFCDLVGWLFGCSSADCTTCFDKCMACSVDDPCHSCDPCGLSWLLCHIIPGGHC